jgi:hypothetical protein
MPSSGHRRFDRDVWSCGRLHTGARVTWSLTRFTTPMPRLGAPVREGLVAEEVLGHLTNGDTMQLSPGMRLRSQVCTTEVVVVRAPETLVELGCGGAPLTVAGTDITVSSAPVAGLDSPSLLGKRYTSAAASSLELLVVKAGAGTLTADGEALVLREAKPLPSSD